MELLRQRSMDAVNRFMESDAFKKHEKESPEIREAVKQLQEERKIPLEQLLQRVTI